MRRPPSQPPELPGYTFVRILGSGGFSDVYLYEQKLPKRRVAIKVLLTDELSTATRTAFVAEANLMAKLSAHPYIVTIFHADVASDDRPYFVMEYCSGPSLAESYKQQTMAVSDALRTGVRLSSAIATAHSAGILHRDIKPANVLTNDFGWPALTDFGISSAADDALLPVHTGTLADAIAETTGATGASVGMSVPWSPPEMFEDDPAPDIRSDVFSLAATIYTVLAGHTPFEVRGRSNTALDLIGRIERGAVTAMDRDDLPRSLVAVLHKGMASDRADRFATAVDFARALQRVELELGYSPTAIDVPNLQVEAPERYASSADADATKARTVATIDAQPAYESAIIGGPPGADAVETIVRDAVRVDAQPFTEASEQTIARPAAAPAPLGGAEGADAGAVTPQPVSRIRRLVMVGCGVIAPVILGAVAVSLVMFGAPTTPPPTPDRQTGGVPAVSPGIPTPELEGTALEGSDVVFAVANPDPEDGDTFRWRISNGGNDERFNAVADGRIVIEGYTGQRVCVEVLIVRAGKDSSNALNTCYPE